MSVLIPIAAGFFIGLLAFYLIPLVARAHRPTGDRVAHYYLKRIGMPILGRALLIKRKHGGFYLKASSYDSKHAKEKTVINGETKHFDDPANMMSRLGGWPFALAHEESGTIITPRLAEVARESKRRERKGELTITKNGDEYVNGYAPIPNDTNRLVDLDDALALLPGNAEPGTTDWAIEVTKQSLSPFHEKNLMDYATGLIVAGAMWGLCYVGYQVVGDSGGPSGTVTEIGIGMITSGVLV